MARRRAVLPPSAFNPKLKEWLLAGARAPYPIAIPEGLSPSDRNKAIGQLRTLVRRLNEYRYACKHAKEPDYALLYRCSISTRHIDDGRIVLEPTDSDYGLLSFGAGGQPPNPQAVAPSVAVPGQPAELPSALPPAYTPSSPAFDPAFLADFDALAGDDTQGA